MSQSQFDQLVPSSVRVSPVEASKRLLPWLVAVAFFMEQLDTTILNTAVPAVAAALQVTPLSMKSVLSTYTLSLAVFIPISGWMADRFGTRRVFTSAIGLFTLGSLLCGMCSDVRLLIGCRILQGCGGAMMVPVGRLTLVETFDKSELMRAMSFVAIPALIGPLLGPIAGGLIVTYLHWRVIFFLNIPVGLFGLLMVHLYLPDYRAQQTPPLDVVGLILFGSGIGLLSYVLEVFGEHTLSVGEIVGLLAVSLSLIAGYWLHAKQVDFPLLQLGLLRIRTFGTTVAGSFFTRVGIGGVPFLLPLLYQVGLGFTPVQSGLLIIPQAAASMIVKLALPSMITTLGYRGVLISNTLAMGLLVVLFATVGLHTPVWVIVLLGFLFGAFTSVQFTSMNTLTYADIAEEKTSNASSIASTVQQMAMSFGVASAGLAAVFFIPAGFRSNPEQMIHGTHQSFVALGVLTVISTIIFGKLQRGDGDNINPQKVMHAG